MTIGIWMIGILLLGLTPPLLALILCLILIKKKSYKKLSKKQKSSKKKAGNAEQITSLCAYYLNNLVKLKMDLSKQIQFLRDMFHFYLNFLIVHGLNKIPNLPCNM